MEWQLAQKKNKKMTNSSNAIRSRITANGQELERVKQVNYIGAIISDEGSKTEILARSAQTSAPLTKLKLKSFREQTYNMEEWIGKTFAETKALARLEPNVQPSLEQNPYDPGVLRDY